MKLPTLLECDCLVQVKEMYSLFMHKFMPFLEYQQALIYFVVIQKKKFKSTLFVCWWAF